MRTFEITIKSNAGGMLCHYRQKAKNKTNLYAMLKKECSELGGHTSTVEEIA